MNTNQRQLVDELLDLEEGLTDWEIKFIEDLDRLDRPLSKCQSEKLKQLHESRIK